MEDDSIPDGKPKAPDSADPGRQKTGDAANDEEAGTAKDEAVDDAASDDQSKTSNAARARLNAEAILLPDNNSILFGRGKSCNNHPGNIKMRLIINKYKDEYQTSVRGEKFHLVRRVYGELVDEGMKFLRPSEGKDGWVEVGVEAAIQKVGHALRNTNGGKIKSKKITNIGEPQAASVGGMFGANAGAAALETSTAALVGTAREQLARIPSVSSSSMQLGAGSTRSGGLVDLGGLFQPPSTAALLGSLQEQLVAARGLSALPAPLGTSVPIGMNLLPQGTLGIGGNSIANPLLALESYRREVELQRLRSALLLPVGQVTLPSALPPLSANHLNAIAERDFQFRHDDQLRQLLLHHQLSRNSRSSLGQSEGENQGPFHQGGQD